MVLAAQGSLKVGVNYILSHLKFKNKSKKGVWQHFVRLFALLTLHLPPGTVLFLQFSIGLQWS